MVAFPAAIVKASGKELKLGCKLQAAPSLHCPFSVPASDPHMFDLISSWPWESQEELEEEELVLQEGLSPKNSTPPPNNMTNSTPALPKLCQITSAANKVYYSLSSGPSSTSSRVISSSRSSSTRSTQSLPSFSPSASTIEKFSSLWEDELGTSELPPIDPYDYMKTLLCQLAASISSIKTAYAHQQAALNPYNMPAIHGQEGGSAGMAIVSATDKAMVEELQRLSHLHSQLALLPHMLTFKKGAEVVVEVKKDSMMQQQQLKRYEGIITRFHEEMGRKDAVTEALKETLAKSMLKGEKLQQRVEALEAKLST